MLHIDIEGLKGDSLDIWHAGEFVVLAFSWVIGEAAEAGPAGHGANTLSDLSLTMHVGAATPALIEACYTGRVFAKARLTQHTKGHRPMDFFSFTLLDVCVTSVSLSASDGEDPAAFMLTLGYRELSVESCDQNADGSPAARGVSGPLLR